MTCYFDFCISCVHAQIFLLLKMCQYYLVDYFFNSKCIWRLNVIFSNAFVNGWFNGSTIVNDWIIAPSKLNFQISALIWLVIPFRWIYPARISLKDKINTYVMKRCFLKTRYFFCKINLKEMHIHIFKNVFVLEILYFSRLFQHSRHFRNPKTFKVNSPWKLHNFVSAL